MLNGLEQQQPGERECRAEGAPALLRAGAGSTCPLEVPCSPNLFVTLRKLDGGACRAAGHQILSEKGWQGDLQLLLHGCSSWGRGVSLGRGRGAYLSPSVPPAELGKPFHPLPVVL